LIELLVLLALLALLASALVPILRNWRDRARLELCAARIDELGKACLKFEADGVRGGQATWFAGLEPGANVLPWRNLRAIQQTEDLPPEWADPLCIRKLTLFLKDKEGATPIATAQGLYHLFPSYVRDTAALYCPASRIWTAERGWQAEDGSVYVTYCSREGGAQTPEGRAIFNSYASADGPIAFLSCASFLGYQAHPRGWNVWFTDGGTRFHQDPHGVLAGLSADEWFDVPHAFPPPGRWSIWTHFDQRPSQSRRP
jgi:hypothetical protein